MSPFDLMTYPVLTPVEHDGRRFEPGETIDLDDTESAALFQAGAVGPAIGNSDVSTKRANAAIVIARIQQAASAEEVDTLLAGDQRVTVVAAAEARKTALAG